MKPDEITLLREAAKECYSTKDDGIAQYLMQEVLYFQDRARWRWETERLNKAVRTAKTVLEGVST